MQPFKYKPPSLDSGKFRHRITFQEFAEGYDSDGFPVEGWNDIKTVWCAIKTPLGVSFQREIYEGNTIHGEITYRFIIRYTEGIHSDMRINYNGRTFEIIAPPVNDEELNKTLTIVGKELV
jgi:SPP1 family predicted phage head-tail adaptor